VESEDHLGRSIAVIGSGVAGLTAAYVLSARNRVTLFEADIRLGGHAHTHYVDDGDGCVVGIDSAFLVHNDRTYPTLCRLFTELGVATRDTDMSMSVRNDGSRLEYAGARGIGGLFPSLSSLVRPRYLLMLAEVKRFHAAATTLLDDESVGDEPLGEFIDRHGFSEYFVEHFMTPLVAAVWSCAPGNAMRYPARYLFVFLQHHGMLSVFGSPTWRTVVGGSASYVNAIAQKVHEIVAGRPVRRGRHRHASRPGVADARRTDGPGTRRARRYPLLHQPRSVAHRRLGAAPQAAGARVLELPGDPGCRQGVGDL
jgi:predicted NAD/FAD-binding protein